MRWGGFEVKVEVGVRVLVGVRVGVGLDAWLLYLFGLLVGRLVGLAGWLGWLEWNGIGIGIGISIGVGMGIGIGIGFGIVFVALITGALVGRLLGFQKQLNKLGAYARERLSKSDEDGKGVSEGFVTCTILFCVGPMSLVGPIEDGLGRGVPFALLAKSAMDGVATLAMAPRFGWGVMLAVIPVVSLQGTVTLLARTFEPLKDNPELLASVSLTGGMMVMTIVLVILEIRKVPLADYLPALIVAPLMASWLL